MYRYCTAKLPLSRYLARRVWTVFYLRSNVPTLVIRVGGFTMTITTLSSRELNQDVTRAKKAAKSGPVFITDRGKPAHVLLSIEEYQRLTRQRRNIADSLAMPDIADIEFEPPRVTIGTQPADLS